jgi:hypothetical protein
MKYGIQTHLPAADLDLAQRFHCALLMRMHHQQANGPRYDSRNPLDRALAEMGVWAMQNPAPRAPVRLTVAGAEPWDRSAGECS